MRHISQYNKQYSLNSLSSLIKKVKKSKGNVFSKLSLFEYIEVHTPTIYTFADSFKINVYRLKNITDNRLIPLDPSPLIINTLDYFTITKEGYSSNESIIDNLILDYQLSISIMDKQSEHLKEYSLSKIDSYYRELYNVLLYYYAKSINGVDIMENF